MTQHLHNTFVVDCFRCDLSRDEVDHEWNSVVEGGITFAACDNDGSRTDSYLEVADSNTNTDKQRQKLYFWTKDGWDLVGVPLDREQVIQLYDYIHTWLTAGVDDE